jgi:hypothetical protein
MRVLRSRANINILAFCWCYSFFMSDEAALTGLFMVGGVVICGVMALVRQGSASRAQQLQQGLAVRQPLPLHVSAAQQSDVDVQAIVEQVLVSYMREFPQANPDQVAILARDSFLASRIHDQRYFAWATAETVQRLMRTAVIAELRRSG